MKINSVSNQSFGRLYISPNYSEAVKKETYRRRFDYFREKVDMIKNSDESHIWVEDNGDVYYKICKSGANLDAGDGKHNPIIGDKPSTIEEKFCLAVNAIDFFKNKMCNQRLEELEKENMRLKYDYDGLKHMYSLRGKDPNVF